MSDEEILSDEVGSISGFEERGEEHEEVESELESLDEDEMDLDGEGEEIRKKIKDKGEEQTRAGHTKHAYSVWNNIMSLFAKNFVFMDKVNRMPQNENMGIHEHLLEKLKKKNVVLKLGLLGIIQDLGHLNTKVTGSGENPVSNMFSSLSQDPFLETNAKGKILNSKIDTNRIFVALEKEFEERQGYWKAESNSWFAKTSLDIHEKDKTLLRKIRHFNQPPYIVSQNSMYDITKMLAKINRKNGFYRILGKRKLDSEVSSNPEIFEERDLANNILHELMSAAYGLEGTNLPLNYTARYIQERRLRRKTKNMVDRKASKNRKLKYGVQEKLINYMSSFDNLDLLESRDQIIDNLFGIPRKRLKVEKQGTTETSGNNDIDIF